MHYAYLHQVSEACGFTTTIVGRIPDHLADAADEWVLDEFLPRWIGSERTRSSVRLRIALAGTREAEVRRHWRLVRLVCRALDPTLQVWADGRERALVDVLSIDRRLRGPLGPLATPHPTRVSRGIGKTARDQAAADGMGLLSAVQDGAWSQAATGWELDEFDDRQRWLEERARERAGILKAWPEDGLERTAQIRMALLAELEASWARDPRRRRPWIS
ncbi:MAG TPA: hypothetical protein VEA41_16345 [Salinarimonas sp.]|nr:hypothetical protein [Salinarimonas sp.]